MNLSLSQHLNFEARNRTLAQNLLNYLQNDLKMNLNNILEIGCGPGWLLDEAKKLKIDSIGYDLSTDAINYGIKNLSLNLKNEYFSKDTKFNNNLDLIICIMVLEHIQYPEEMIESISYHCKKHNCPLLVSVPIIDDLDNIISSILNISNLTSLFCYSPGHTCHYSQEGFSILWRRHGAKQIQRLKINNSWPYIFIIYF